MQLFAGWGSSHDQSLTLWLFPRAETYPQPPTLPYSSNVYLIRCLVRLVRNMAQGHAAKTSDQRGGRDVE